ncbi:hypothetical protein BC829DRAFT_280376 [Chytridium lagenaria]|nr:hypothetical protein BC829DRAFT_280376 [Chytridium lagenaria]
MSTLYDKNDRTLAKSNIFAVEGGFYSETIAPIGKLKLQRRRLFDWTPKQAVFASFVERGSIHMIVLIELETHRVHYYPLQDIEEHSIRVQSTQQAKESAVTEVAGRDPNRRSVTLFLPRSTFMLWTQSAEQLSLLENGLRHTVRMAQRRSTREDKSRVTGATKEPTMSVVGTGHST